MNPLRRFWLAVINDGAPPTPRQRAESFRRAARKGSPMQRVTVVGAHADLRSGRRDLPTATVVELAVVDGSRRTVNIHDWESVTERFPAGLACSVRIPTRTLRNRGIGERTDDLDPPFPGPRTTPWPPHDPPGDDDFIAYLGRSASRDDTDPGAPTGPLTLFSRALAEPIAVDDTTAGAAGGMSPEGWAGLVRIDPVTGRPTRVGVYPKPWLAPGLSSEKS